MRWYRSHSGTVPTLSDRNLSSEASTPGSVTICRWFARRTGAGTPTSICFRTGTLTTGTAAAFGCALAPCDGSDLLPLRLRLTWSWVTRFSRRPKLGGLAGCCLSRAAPRRVVSLARPASCASRALWRVRPLPNTSLRPGRAVAAVTLWVTALVQGPKLALDLTRLGSGFYSRLAAQLLCRKTGPVATPSRGTGDICLSRLASRRGGPHQLRPTFPRLPGIIPVALSAGFSCRRTATVLSRNEKENAGAPGKVTGLLLTISSPDRPVNNLCTGFCSPVIHRKICMAHILQPSGFPALPQRKRSAVRGFQRARWISFPRKESLATGHERTH